MSDHLNLHDFMKGKAALIRQADERRGIDVSNLPDGGGSVVLMTRDYGEVRAADIYNRAYQAVQAFRTHAEEVCMGLFALPIIGVAIFEKGSIMSKEAILDSQTHPYIAFSLAALVIVGMAGMPVVEKLRSRTDRKFRAQFDLDRGRERENAPIDRAVGRKAEKLLRRYLHNADFVRGIPYGEGLMKAKPLVAQRAWNQYQVASDRLYMGIDSAREQVPYAQFALGILGAPSSWNKSKFEIYVRSRVSVLASEGVLISRGKAGELFHTYDQAYVDLRRKRALTGIFAVWGTSAVFLLLLVTWPFVVENVVGFDRAFDLMKFIAAGELGAWGVGGYNGIKILRSAILNRRQVVDSRLNVLAPVDAPVSRKAKNTVDAMLGKMVQAARPKL